MTDAYKGSAQTLKIGPANSSLTAISGEANGLANVSLEPTAGTRVIPGGGASHRQLNGVTDWTFNFTVDANATTWPLLFNKVGADLFFEWGPLGSTGGNPKVTGKGIISIPVPAPTDDVITFTVAVEADGPLAVGSF